jgi:hypothetical protein
VLLHGVYDAAEILSEYWQHFQRLRVPVPEPVELLSGEG